MTDPDSVYAQVADGDPAALAQQAEGLEPDLAVLDDVRDDVEHARALPQYQGLGGYALGLAASSLSERCLVHGRQLRAIGGALDLAGRALEELHAAASVSIGWWRNRPAGLLPATEAVLGGLVVAQLRELERGYDARLVSLAAALRGDEPDLDGLSDFYRDWIEQGDSRTDEWLDGNGSRRGPQIPNIQANGDERGLIPQGLGEVDGTLLQAYYSKNGSGSHLAFVDAATGAETHEVQLGGGGHVGGVTVVGGSVVVVSSGSIDTYDLGALRSAASGERVEPTTEQPLAEGTSYTAYRDGLLYVGSFEENKLRAYRQVGSEWVPATGGDGRPIVIDTPDKAQGVVVRDGELVFSTSHGRWGESALVVQDRETGERGEPYVLPPLSQGVVEVDGELVTSYESGAEHFAHAELPYVPDGLGWFWGVPDADGLWPTRHYTVTPLDEVLDVDPDSLDAGSAAFRDPEDGLRSVAGDVDAVSVSTVQLGSTPGAAELVAAVEDLVDRTVDGLLESAGRAAGISDALASSASTFTATDDGAAATVAGGRRP